MRPPSFFRIQRNPKRKAATVTATVQQFLDLATEQEGVPYVFGGVGLKGSIGPGLDCSGLPYAVCFALGFLIPRTSEEQFADLPAVDAKDVRAGDLVSYNVAADTQPQPAHCAIVLTPGETVLEAPHTGEVVKTAPLNIYPIMGYRRIPELVSAAPAPPAPPAPAPTPQISVKAYQVATGSSEALSVKSVQSLLSSKFNHPVVCDGDFGPATQAAVEDVQRFFGVTVDGVVGPTTWGILLAL